MKEREREFGVARTISTCSVCAKLVSVNMLACKMSRVSQFTICELRSAKSFVAHINGHGILNDLSSKRAQEMALFAAFVKK